MKYKNHLRKTIVSDKLLNRVFYIIIPEKTDIKIQVDDEEMLQELERQAVTVELTGVSWKTALEFIAKMI